MQTMKVKPWSDDQGDHVVINAEDFDPAVHEPLEATGPNDPVNAGGAPRGRKKKSAAEGAE